MSDDDNSGIMKEFEEFLTQKAAAEKSAKDDEDYDVEIWNKEGAGARVKRSHAKPFLQSLGLDLDSDEGNSKPESGDAEPKAARKSTGTGSTKPAQSTSVRKYFTSNKKLPWHCLRTRRRFTVTW